MDYLSSFWKSKNRFLFAKPALGNYRAIQMVEEEPFD